MTLFLFLTVIQAFVAAGLVMLVLMQKSEGGGLGIGGGGSPGGLMSARGAADVLSRATKWFAILFVGLSIVLAAVAVDATGGGDFGESLDRSVTAPGETTGGDTSGAAGAAGTDDPTEIDDDPLADVAE